MASERLVVIGGVAAGLSAASRARRFDPRLEIVVYEKGPDISYSACGLPYLIAGLVPAADSLHVYSPEFFESRRNIRVLTGHEVVEISPGRRRVTVAAPGGGGLEDVPYSRLVIATGAEPARPGIQGLDLAGVFHVNDLQSTLKLERFLTSERPQSAAIIGGGYIGLEMAEALRARGMQVTLVERSALLFGGVDEEISSAIEGELSARGVRVVKPAPVTALVGERQGRVRRLTWEGGSCETPCVILATGVRPRAKLAAEAEIVLGPTGAIAVNEAMETSVAAVYAAGDCAETTHRVSGRPVYFPLGTTANKQGRVAGENAAGGRARFAGVMGTAASKVFGLEVARTGLSRAEAEEAGFAAAAASVHAPSYARYLGGQDMLVKLVADRASGRLLGGQMAGPYGAGNVAKRIDVLATALHARMTVEQVAELDLSYAPPFSTVWDPLLVAAQEMLRELRR
ncbi:MAG TPA: FAD-dependent oxidoreductase [Terriglobia bacterium]|nr:FAD-dependent oxidoreductase [Terriglobia bacterium]